MLNTKEDGVDIDKLLAKAQKPSEDAMNLHPFYRGKVETTLKCVVRDIDDFAIWYTPGVAAPCRAIQEDPEKVYDYTNKWNTVAVISDGTRVLGLGDIGPKAGLPVMEGKALLYKYLGGVDGVAIMLDTKDPDKIIDTVLMLQPSLGGVNLEDLSQPKCFRILDTLREKAEIPVWHDDQQGTATVTLAGLINALKLVGKKMEDARITFVGSGASNVACSRLIFGWGADPTKCMMVDSKGILGPHRKNLERRKAEYVDKWRLCQITNGELRQGGIAEALEGADVVIGLSKPGPGTIKPEWIEKMNDDAIVFACANPVPEIWPWEALEAGAAIVATGRSDFPNQVNNSLGFPGIFRGALDVRARTITDEMCFAAAQALADHIGDKLDREHILPDMEDWEVFAREAAAVGMKAQEQGVARLTKSYDELFNHAKSIIGRSRQITQMMMQEGFIAEAPESVEELSNPKEENKMYDLIVVGGGPAGLTATIYAIRKRLNVLLISKDLGGKTNFHLELPDVESYRVVRGIEVIDKFKRELEYLDFAHHLEPVETIKKSEDGFVVHTKGGGDLSTKAVIVATGTRQQWLDVPGEREFLSKGLCYSALSYAPLFIEKKTVVIGEGDLALRSAAELATVADHVHVVGPTGRILETPLGQKLVEADNVTVLEGYRVNRVLGNGYCNRVVVEDPEGKEVELEADGTFVEKALRPNSQMVEGLVELDEDNFIKVDSYSRTTVPGVFAAGDVTNIFAEQVLVATGEGVKAALSAYEYLLPKL